MEKMAARTLFSALCGLSLGVASYETLYRIAATQTLDYDVALRGASPAWLALFCLCGAVFGIAVTALFDRAEAKGGLQANSWTLQKAASPLLALAAIPIFKPCFWTIIAYVAIASVSLFRILAAWPGGTPLPNRLRLSPASAWGLLLALVCFSSVYGYLLQLKTFNALYLGGDQDVFIDTVWQTLQGKPFYCDLLGRSLLGQHFDVGMVLILAPFIWLKPAMETLFAANAVALYIGAIGIFALARAKGCGLGEALALASVYALHPSLSSMTVCIFYGFHESNLLIMLVVFFFLALEKGRRKTAIAILLLSLSVKETAAIFWTCAGAALALDKERRPLGVAIALGSLAWFFALEGLIMPAISGAKYEFIDVYYGDLGSSVAQIALSPILKPWVFWPHLFRPANFLFLALFLLPAFITSSAKPRLYLGFAGILAFMFLKDSTGLCTINSWYQAEILGLLNIASVLGFVSLAGLGGAPPLNGLLSLGLPLERRLPSRGFAQAALAGALLAALLSFFLFALGCPFGKNSWAKKHIGTNVDFTEELENWDKLLPQDPEERISTSLRLRGHFLIRHKVSDLSRPPEETVLLDLDDNADVQVETFRRRLLLGQSHSIVAFDSFKGHTWLLFKKAERPAPQPKTTFKAELKDWERIGVPVCEDSIVSVRAAPQPPQQPDAKSGFRPVTLFFRLKEKVDCELSFLIVSSYEEGGRWRSPSTKVHFGLGATPAYLAEAGDCFQVQVDIPASGKASLKVDTIREGKPNTSLPPF